VNAPAPLGRFAGDLLDDGRAPVAALGEPAVIAEALHEGDPRVGDAGDVPAGRGRFVGEPETRHGRDHDVKGVLGVAAVGDRIGQRADQVPELQNRAGPAVAQQQRCGAGLGRAHVQEVDADPVQDGAR
jgi:hypothetical protein